jgi:GT2 family glycosyltransferase
MFADAPPSISIVTPSFNQAAYLEETIQSVLSQGYPRLEYIIIDGGSTDGSVDVIRKYGDRLAYWVSESDAGQSAAINKGFRRATGDIVAWINSDDTYLPGTLRHAAQELSAHPESDLVYGHCHYIDGQGSLLQRVDAWDFSPRRILTGIPTIIQPASFMRRRALERVGLLDESLHFLMDHDLYVRLLLGGCTFTKVDAVWACFRWHASSKTHNQWVGFNLELQKIVERTFAQPGEHVRPGWRPEATANAWQWLGEAHLMAGSRRESRAALVNAIRACPLRPKTLMALALLLDASLGTHLSGGLRRLRYRLPDAPRQSRPLESLDDRRAA